LGYVTVSIYAERHAVSYLTARHDLEALVEQGCLARNKVARTVLYRPVRDLINVLTGG